VIGARFGDPERDEAARKALAKVFRKHQVVMLTINHIANCGGGIHCLTQPMAA
jgi:agmatine deiminase